MDRRAETKLYEFSRIDTRPPIEWPGGARLAVWVVPNVEYYEYLPSRTAVRNPYPRVPHPDIDAFAYRDYGNRVGIWRVLDVLDESGIPCTVSTTVAVLRHIPELLDAIEERGFGYLCHGLYNTRYLWGMTSDEVHEHVALCQTLFTEITDRPVRGWFSPALSYSTATISALVDSGFQYHCDWFHDDQPTWCATDRGSLVSIPYNTDLNDAVLLRSGGESAELVELVKSEFETLRSEQGRVFCFAFHPYIMGRPQRIEDLRKILEIIGGHDDVWYATGDQIASWYASSGPKLEEVER